MTPLAVFVRTLMKTSAIFLGASWIVLHPSLDWSARSAAVTAELAPREAALAGLRLALSDQDPAVRRQAAQALAKIRSGRPFYGDPVRQTRTVKELVTDLTDGDPVVRTRAACDLREAGDRAIDAIQPLVELLADGTRVDPEVCGRERWNTHRQDPTSPGEQAARALASIGSRVFDPVLSTLESRAWTARKNAAWTLGALDDSRAVQALVAALRDTEPSVREQVAWALGAIGDDAAVDGLVAALKDENARVREQAAWALGAIGNAKATDALLPLLKDQDVGVRRQAAWAIGAIGR
ncbi:MAG TPA: HEAT repeat domain-containing protein [Vicinamibacterales bacterium]